MVSRERVLARLARRAAAVRESRAVVSEAASEAASVVVAAALAATRALRVLSQTVALETQAGPPGMPAPRVREPPACFRCP